MLLVHHFYADLYILEKKNWSALFLISFSHPIFSADECVITENVNDTTTDETVSILFLYLFKKKNYLARNRALEHIDILLIIIIFSKTQTHTY